MIRRLLLVLVLVLAGTAVGPAASASPDDQATDGTSYGTPLTPLTGAKQGLVWHDTRARATALQANVGNDPGFSAVMASANHPMRTMADCDADETEALPVAPAATVALCWDAGDADTTAWHPQGLTTSGDADDDGAWGAHEVILSGWHSLISGRYNDARVAFIDHTDPAAPKYRWVYLVEPNATGTSFTAAKAHIGGMAWYGDKLFVSAVGNNAVAIRVFDMHDILQMTDGADAIGKTARGYSAYGYQYVLPQVGYYTYAGGSKCTMNADGTYPSYTIGDNDGDGTAGNTPADWVGTGTRSMTNESTIACFSSLSLDRSTSPASLVTSEYFGHRLPDHHGRLYRYSFDGTSDFLLKTASNGTTVSPVEAERSYVGNQNGVLSRSGTWYISHSWRDARGGLWKQTSAGSTAATCAEPGNTARQCWARHPEGLTYNVATGLVWSQTEWSAANECAPQGQSCGRAIFGFPLP